MTNSFKLIAIVPLIGCAQKFRKNLHIGTPYQFYQNYDLIVEADGSKINSVIPKDFNVASEGLYNLDDKLGIQISAVVGKNGSGKSTLFDLLYQLIYIISTETKHVSEAVLDNFSEDLKETLKQHKKAGRKIKDWNTLENDNAYEELFKIVRQFDLKIQPESILNPRSFLLEARSALFNKILKIGNAIKAEEKAEEELKDKLNLSIIYEQNKQLFELSYFNREIQYSRFDNGQRIRLNETEKFKFQDFFYNISLNYSHHSLNSLNIGNWIMKLFHKNDGYITPLFINPMRNEGSFDINREIKLSRERIMINIIYSMVHNKDYRLLNKYRITKFIFWPKKLSPTDNKYVKKISKKHIVKNLISDYVTISNDIKTSHYWAFAIIYLDQKIERIRDNYKAIIFKEGHQVDEILLKFLRENDSHITKKIRQTLEFFKMTADEKGASYWKVPPKDVTKRIVKEDFFDWLKLREPRLEKLTPLELNTISHPGFLSVDFELESSDGSTLDFSSLSSGEQQMIYNENTLLYHLYNLQSVYQGQTKTENRLKYEYVNIILDEIELYYHPEMQQKLIQNLIKSFENIKDIVDDGIKAVNIILCTHSPFILSDIPTSNILRLDDGKPNDEPVEKSFGANIHDILHDDFFMNKSFMGAFAETKINQVINWLNYHRLRNDFKKLKKGLRREVTFIELLELEASDNLLKEMSNNYVINFIALIDEPLLQKTMEDMYYSLDFGNSLNYKIK